MKLLERFGMVECKSLTTSMEINFKKLCEYVVGLDLENPSKYQHLIGPFMFFVNTCSNICFVVNTLSQFMTEPLHAHWIVAKLVLRYLHGTIKLGLRYIVEDVQIHGYCDANWAGNVINMKSTSGCCCSSGSAMISWMSRKQKSIEKK